MAFDDNARAEFLQGGFVDFPIDLRPVGARVVIFGVEESGVQSGFIGEQQQAFAVAVESAEGIDIFGQAALGEGG